jgi:hypothetical protein
MARGLRAAGLTAITEVPISAARLDEEVKDIKKSEGYDSNENRDLGAFNAWTVNLFVTLACRFS